MSLVWGRTLCPKRWWKAALATAGCIVISIAVITCNRDRRLIELNKDATGIGPVGWDSSSTWHQTSWSRVLYPRNPKTQQVRLANLASVDLDNQTRDSATDDATRRMVRTASLEVEVKDTSACMEQIRALAGREGGYLVASSIGGNPDSPSGTIAIRVPVQQLDETRMEIRKLAVRVESEKIEANDVTGKYVDQEANLRNLRAQESQYLRILKRANTVKDAMEVTGKLSEVRGEIEQRQAEFAALVKQVETIEIDVTLIPEAEAQVFGIHWRPWYSIKLAARDGMEGLATFGGTFTAAVFLLPAIILWLAMIILCAAVGIRILRWAWRHFFTFSRPGAADPQPAPGA